MGSNPTVAMRRAKALRRYAVARETTQRVRAEDHATGRPVEIFGVDSRRSEDGGTGRRAALKTRWLRPCGFDSRSSHTSS